MIQTHFHNAATPENSLTTYSLMDSLYPDRQNGSRRDNMVMMFEGKKILVIDDAASIRTFLRISLQANHATFFEATNAQEGLDQCKSHKPDVVVLDLGLPDRDGLDILPELKQAATGVKVVILSVRKEPTVKQQAFSLGASGYVTKPFLMDDLIEVVQRQL